MRSGFVALSCYSVPAYPTLYLVRPFAPASQLGLEENFQKNVDTFARFQLQAPPSDDNSRKKITKFPKRLAALLTLIRRRANGSLGQPNE